MEEKIIATSEQTLEDMLREALASNHVRFTFTKKDGTIREAYGTRMSETIEKNNATPTGNGGSNPCAYFDLEKKAWRSWREGSVTSFEPVEWTDPMGTN